MISGPTAAAVKSTSAGADKSQPLRAEALMTRSSAALISILHPLHGAFGKAQADRLALRQPRLAG